MKCSVNTPGSNGSLVGSQKGAVPTYLNGAGGFRFHKMLPEFVWEPLYLKAIRFYVFPEVKTAWFAMAFKTHWCVSENLRALGADSEFG